MKYAPHCLVRQLTAPVLAIVLISGIAAPARAQVDAWIDPGHGGKDPGTKH